MSAVDDAYAVMVQGACPGRLVSFATPFVWQAVPAAEANMCRVMSGKDLTMIKTSRGYMQRTPSMSDVVAAAAGSMRGEAH